MANYFENELSTTFRAFNYHWCKLAVASTKRIAFLKDSHYDFFVLSDGNYYAIEAKSKKVFASFEFSLVREHQVESLKHAKSRGGHAYFLINFRKPKNIVYAIDIEDFIEMRNNLLTGEKPRKSIPREYFGTNDKLLKCVKTKIDDKLVWDLREIIK